MNNKRIVYLDYLKAFTIFCVLFGHSIQEFHGSIVMDKIHAFIYSFHMPLFMTISGFFLCSLLEKPLWQTASRKARQLLLPVLSFSVIVFLLKLAHIIDFTQGLSFIGYLVGGDMWFLKYLYVCILLACLSKLIFRKTLIAALVPAILLISLSRVGIFRIYPFLWLGFMLNYYNDFLTRHKGYVILSCLTVFVVSQFFWVLEYDYPHYRWLTIKNGIEFDFFHLYVVSFRFIIGASGSILFIYLFKFLFERDGMNCDTIAKSGTRTLGIYCLQIYCLEKAADYITMPDMHPIVLDILIIIIAIIELIICNTIVALLERNRWSALFLLGKK